MVQGAILWLASPNDLQHAIEIFLGYGIVGIKLQSGPQVGFGGCQMSLIHVHEPQITVGQIAVRIESLYQLEFRLRLRIVFLIEPMDALACAFWPSSFWARDRAGSGTNALPTDRFPFENRWHHIFKLVLRRLGRSLPKTTKR